MIPWSPIHRTTTKWCSCWLVASICQVKRKKLNMVVDTFWFLTTRKSATIEIERWTFRFAKKERWTFRLALVPTVDRLIRCWLKIVLPAASRGQESMAAASIRLLGELIWSFFSSSRWCVNVTCLASSPFLSQVSRLVMESTYRQMKNWASGISGAMLETGNSARGVNQRGSSEWPRSSVMIA